MYTIQKLDWHLFILLLDHNTANKEHNVHSLLDELTFRIHYLNVLIYFLNTLFLYKSMKIGNKMKEVARFLMLEIHKFRINIS
jgi:hypothetical protein